MHSKVGVATILLFTVAMSSCKGRGAYEKLTLNYERWKQHNVDSYVMTYKMRCFCLNDNVIQEQLVSNGEVAYSDGLTVELMFQLAFDSIDSENMRVEYAFNSAFGYPTTLSFKDSSGTDLNVDITVISLQIENQQGSPR